MVRKNKQTGFTIVELLIVIVVIAILAAISIVAYVGIQNMAHDTAVKSDLTNLKKHVELYKAEFAKYPRGQDMASITGFRAATGSYMVAPVTDHNLIYCMSIVDTSIVDYALVAYSKSGKKFQVTNSSSLQEYDTAWTDQTVACQDALPSHTNNHRGYAADGPDGPWRNWVGGN